jgi:hypothetical protein
MAFGRRTRGLGRTVARTAVITGTAAATANAVNARAAERAGSPAPAADAAEHGPVLDPYEQLERLGKLHASGVLTDEEFAQLKAKAIGAL